MNQLLTSTVAGTRRRFLTGSVGLSAATLFGCLKALGTQAAEAGVKHKSCILLFMDGGPSHVDTFDPKPDAPDGYGGPLKPISTSVPGIYITEVFPSLAGQMEHAAIIRGMSTKEIDHHRASYHLHTGHRPRVGLIHPGLGAIASKELGNDRFTLPNYIHLGPRRNNGLSSGYLGPRHQPLIAGDGWIENLKSGVSRKIAEARFGLLKSVEDRFQETHQSLAAKAHSTSVERAAKMMSSQHLAAFDISKEPNHIKQAYGESSKFGASCLRARRLVEAGVPFVEVSSGGWDQHSGIYTDPRTNIRELAAEVDIGMAALTSDLRERGMLDSTLIIWMGEFGRTPKLNGSGRDHYSKAWSIVLVGGGINGGQVIGRTDRLGGTVKDRPVSVADLMATICRILGIDCNKQYRSLNGRPIPIIDSQTESVRPLTELYG